ncbi:MAG: tetratricopeptide repeat protein [Betaproteobacteria bacterium]
MKMGNAMLTGLLAVFFSFAAQAGSAKVQLEQADKYWADGKFEQAQKAFETAVAEEPDLAPVRLRLAGFQLARQQTGAAISNYQKVVSQEPRNSTAWIGMGLAYLHSSRPELARAAFTEAVRVDPSRQEKIAPLIARLEAR